MRAPEPQESALVPAMAPAGRGAPQGAQPSAPAMRAQEPQQSAPVPAMAPADSGARQGAQPSAPAQQSIPIRAPPSAASGAPQGGEPSAQPLCAAEPQHSTPLPAMAPVDSAETQGAQTSSQPPCAALPQQPTRLPTTVTLNNMDYGPDDNLVEGFTQRWLDRDRFVTTASKVYTVHEMEAAEVWADKNGTKRNLAFERLWLHGDGDGDGNAPPPPQWASEMEVWGNFELSDGDMVRGWISGNPSWDNHKPDFEARVHGDGLLGQLVWISCANKPRTNLIGNYWCKVVSNTCAFHTLRREIQKGAAWPKLLANMRAEPRDTPPLSTEDQDILKHLVKQHGLNPSQALAVRQVLDESCITALTGGAGTGKSETLVACIKAVLWQQGLLVAQYPDPVDLGTLNMGRKVGGPETDTKPRACVLVSASTNAQVDMLLARVHEECYKDSVFREKVLGDHPAPWLRLRAQRATAPPGWAPFDREAVQKTLSCTPGCKATLKCALNSCRVLFATAGMVANRHKMLLGKGQEKTRFAFFFLDEASRHNIPVGPDLAGTGSQCMPCGDPARLRPYSHVQLLASACEAEKAEVVPEALAWPRDDTFKFDGVVRDCLGPQVHWHYSLRFCTTSTLQFFLYRTRCRADILVQQYQMTTPLAALMRALFTGGSVGHYHSSENPLPDPILDSPIRIVDIAGSTWWGELKHTLGAEALGRMYHHVEEAWANLRMDPVLLSKGGLSKEEGLLVCHFSSMLPGKGPTQHSR